MQAPLGEPDEQVILAPGQSCTIPIQRTHSVENAGAYPARLNLSAMLSNVANTGSTA